MMIKPEKLNITDFIGKIVEVQIDRPIHSKHPEHGYEYLLNYGFVPDTIATDGEEIDAYVLGVSGPVDFFTGRCIAVIHRLDDNEDKLIIVPDGMNFSDDMINELTNFQEQFFKSVILHS